MSGARQINTSTSRNKRFLLSRRERRLCAANAAMNMRIIVVSIVCINIISNQHHQHRQPRQHRQHRQQGSIVNKGVQPHATGDFGALSASWLGEGLVAQVSMGLPEQQRSFARIVDIAGSIGDNAPTTLTMLTMGSYFRSAELS